MPEHFVDEREDLLKPGFCGDGSAEVEAATRIVREHHLGEMVDEVLEFLGPPPCDGRAESARATIEMGGGGIGRSGDDVDQS